MRYRIHWRVSLGACLFAVAVWRWGACCPSGGEAWAWWCVVGLGVVAFVVEALEITRES